MSTYEPDSRNTPSARPSFNARKLADAAFHNATLLLWSLMSPIVVAPLLILLVATPALADPPRQFNLECRGFALTEEPPGRSTGQSEPWINIYRVDLDKGLWCSGLCDYSPSPISYASDDEIIFKATNDKLTSEIIQVNRITGKLEIALTFHGTQRDGARKITAKCNRTDFTGLPVPKF